MVRVFKIKREDTKKDLFSSFTSRDVSQNEEDLLTPYNLFEDQMVEVFFWRFWIKEIFSESVSIRTYSYVYLTLSFVIHE